MENGLAELDGRRRIKAKTVNRDAEVKQEWGSVDAVHAQRIVSVFNKNEGVPKFCISTHPHGWMI